MLSYNHNIKKNQQTMNVQNRTIFSSDNLPVLRGIDTQAVDLIYLDPPFNSNRNYAAPIGSNAAGAAFKDTWTLSDVDNAWHGEIADREPALYQAIHAAELTHGKGMKSYLIMMAVRLLEMKRVLKKTGSIYLHCDPTASHYLKMLMDSVFGRKNFRNEIVWQRTSAHNDSNRFGRVHDIILSYSNGQKGVWNPIYTEHNPEYIAKFYRHKDERGRYQVDNLTAAGVSQGDSGKAWRGVNPTDVGRHWALPHKDSLPEGVDLPENYDSISLHEKLDVLDTNELIYWPPRGRVPRYKRYLSTSKGRRVHDVITDINPLSGRSKERVGYPTQKPIALLERIIKASSNRGDIVLDPFCGCATTCVAAERHQRHWIGIDISPKAVDLVRIRLENEVGMFGKVIHRTDIPKRSEKLPNYRTHKHTLYGKQEGLCNGCQTQFPFRNMTIDHIVPQSQGGTDHEDNLQLLCGACNSTKGQGTQAQLISRLKAQGVLR